MDEGNSMANIKKPGQHSSQQLPYFEGESERVCVKLRPPHHAIDQELANLRAEREKEMEDLRDLEHVIGLFEERMENLKRENKSLQGELKRLNSVGAMKTLNESLGAVGISRIEKLERMWEKVSISLRQKHDTSILRQVLRVWSSETKCITLILGDREVICELNIHHNLFNDDKEIGLRKCVRDTIQSGVTSGEYSQANQGHQGASDPHRAQNYLLASLNLEHARLRYELRGEQQRSETLEQDITAVTRKFTNLMEVEKEQSARIAQRLMKADEMTSAQATELAELRKVLSILEAKHSAACRRLEVQPAPDTLLQQVHDLKDDAEFMRLAQHRLVTRLRWIESTTLQRMLRMKNEKTRFWSVWICFVGLQKRSSAAAVRMIGNRKTRAKGIILRIWRNYDLTSGADDGQCSAVSIPTYAINTQAVSCAESISSFATMKPQYPSRDSGSMTRENIAHGCCQCTQLLAEIEPLRAKLAEEATRPSHFEDSSTRTLKKSNQTQAESEQGTFCAQSNLEQSQELMVKENARLLEMNERLLMKIKSNSLTPEHALAETFREENRVLISKLDLADIEKKQYLLLFRAFKEVHNDLSGLSEDILSMAPCPNFRNELASLAFALDPSSQVQKMMILLKCCRERVQFFGSNFSRFIELFYKSLSIIDLFVCEGLKAAGPRNREPERSPEPVPKHISFHNRIVMDREGILKTLDFLQDSACNQAAFVRMSNQLFQTKPVTSDLPRLLSDFLVCSQFFRDRDAMLSEHKAYEHLFSELQDRMGTSEMQIKEDLFAKQKLISSLTAKLTIIQDESNRLRRIVDGHDSIQECNTSQKFLEDAIFSLSSKLAKKNAEVCDLERQVQSLTQRLLEGSRLHVTSAHETALRSSSKELICCSFIFDAEPQSWNEEKQDSFINDLSVITNLHKGNINVKDAGDSRMVMDVDFVCRSCDISDALYADLALDQGCLKSKWGCIQLVIEGKTSVDAGVTISYNSIRDDNFKDHKQIFRDLRLYNEQSASCRSATAALSSQLAELRFILASAIANTVEAKGLAHKFETENRKLKSLVSICEHKCSQLKSEIEGFEARCKFLSEEAASAQKTISCMQSELKIFKENETKLVQEMSLRSTDMYVLEQRYSQLLNKNSLMEKQISSPEILDMLELLESTSKKCDTTFASFRMKISTRELQFRGQQFLITRNFCDFKTEIAVLNQDFISCILELISSFSDLEILKSGQESMAVAQALQFEQEKAAWWQKSEHLIQENTNLRQEIEGQQDQILELTVSCKRLCGERDHFRKELESSFCKISATQSELDSILHFLTTTERSTEKLDLIHIDLMQAITDTIQKHTSEMDQLVADQNKQSSLLLNLDDKCKSYQKLLCEEQKTKALAQSAVLSLELDFETRRQRIIYEHRNLFDLLQEFTSLLQNLCQQMAVSETISKKESALRKIAEQKAQDLKQQLDQMQLIQIQDSSALKEIQKSLETEKSKSSALFIDHQKLFASIERKNAEILSLQNLVKEISAQKDQTKQSVIKVSQESKTAILDLRSQINENSLVMERLESEKVYLVERVADLNSQLSVLSGKLNHRESCIEKLQFSEMMLQSSLGDTKCLLEGRDRTVIFLTSALQGSIVRTQASQYLLTQIQNEATELVRSINSIRLVLDHEISQSTLLFNNMTGEINSFREINRKVFDDFCLEVQNHNTSRQDNEKLHVTCAKYMTTIKQCELIFADLQTSCPAYICDLDIVLKDLERDENWSALKKAEAARLLLENQTLSARIKEMEASFSIQELAMKKTEQDIEKIAMELADSVSSNLDLSERLSATGTAVEGMRRELENKTADFLKVNDECQQLAMLVGKLNNDLVQTAGMHQNLVQVAENQRLQMRTMELDLEDKATALLSAEQRAETLESELKDKVHVLNEKLLQMENEANNDKSKLCSCMDEVHQCKANAIIAQSRYENLMLKVKQLEKESSHASEKLMEYDRILQVKGREIAKLHGHLAEAKSLVADAEERVATLTKNMMSTRQQSPNLWKSSSSIANPADATGYIEGDSGVFELNLDEDADTTLNLRHAVALEKHDWEMASLKLEEGINSLDEILISMSQVFLQTFGLIKFVQENYKDADLGNYSAGDRCRVNCIHTTSPKSVSVRIGSAVLSENVLRLIKLTTTCKEELGEFQKQVGQSQLVYASIARVVLLKLKNLDSKAILLLLSRVMHSMHFSIDKKNLRVQRFIELLLRWKSQRLMKLAQ